MTAAALFIYKRPYTTKLVLEQIRAYAPRRLYIIADGPKNEFEEVACSEARKITLAVDWDCTVYRLYSDRNLGCRARISSGLDWVFSQEERVIVLEDDCLPSLSFFEFCHEMLLRYERDERVSMICGSQPLGYWDRGTDYYFSRHSLIWGWATWRRTWRHYDVELQNWPNIRESGFVSQVIPSKPEEELWVRRFQKVYDGHDTWDHQLTISCWQTGGRTIVPKSNLVQNIGFGPDATHTVDLAEESILSLARSNLRAPYIGPTDFLCDDEMDARISRILLKELRGGSGV